MESPKDSAKTMHEINIECTSIGNSLFPTSNHPKTKNAGAHNGAKRIAEKSVCGLRRKNTEQA